MSRLPGPVPPDVLDQIRMNPAVSDGGYAFVFLTAHARAMANGEPVANWSHETLVGIIIITACCVYLSRGQSNVVNSLIAMVERLYSDYNELPVTTDKYASTTTLAYDDSRKPN